MSQAMVKKGTPIPAVDAIIAAVAINRELTLFTEDRHFEWVREEFKELKIHTV
ncbi:PIN domain-containing protein [Thermococcus sp.]|uniref:PIN domain-containing protein n=1 Tax=Thermococcus sp. TaxID=35749 RepID=UPI003432ECB1